MDTDLFNIDTTPIRLDMPDADVLYYPHFFNQQKSNEFFEIFMETVIWKQDDIKVFGKTYPQPRLTALYASNNKAYSYSNVTMFPNSFTKELLHVKKKIEIIVPIDFTTCLLNMYRDGQDSNGWHADNEKELGPNPVIASVTFGEERWFHFKHRTIKSLKKKILLKHGSLLLMQGKTQECWLHQIPKTKRIIKPRINLTFRVIK